MVNLKLLIFLILLIVAVYTYDIVMVFKSF